MSKDTYFWVRVYDYVYDRDSHEKGVLLDEFYLKDVVGGRDGAKIEVKSRYVGQSSKDIGFSKPRKRDGLYAIVMDSNKFFFDRFYAHIETFCFWCHKPIKGKACDFPREFIGEGHWYHDGDDVFMDLDKTAYFCRYDCKRTFRDSLRFEGEFQEKEEGRNGEVFGYIYLMYNRAKDVYYIGQTRFMPFFRWQEHIKEGKKGDIKDLTFSVLTEVNRRSSLSDELNQEYLNNVESWWIAKYREEGCEVFNIMNPKLTLSNLRERFQEMIKQQKQLSLEL